LQVVILQGFFILENRFKTQALRAVLLGEASVLVGVNSCTAVHGELTPKFVWLQ
jgi:hypothetical protein